MSAEEGPFLQVVRGNPTIEEVGALIAVLTARAQAAAAAREQQSARPVSAWSDRSRQLRRPLAHGPGAWRASTWPC